MEFREAMRQDVRRLRLHGKIVFPTGAEAAFASEDVGEATVEEGVDDGNLLGAVLSAKYGLKLVGVKGAWLPGGTKVGNRSLQGATVMMEMGVLDADGAEKRAPFGCFVVEEAEGTADGCGMVLKGYDGVYSQTMEAFEDFLKYPVTLNEIFCQILERAGWTFEGELPNGSVVIGKRPAWGTVSLREALSNVLALCGCFMRMDREGRVCVLPVWRSVEAAVEIPLKTVMEMRPGARGFGPLNAIFAETGLDAERNGEVREVVVRADEALADHSGNAVRLAKNPLLMDGGAEETLQGLLAVVGGMRLSEGNFRFRGDPTVQVGDRVCVGETESVLTRQTLKIGSGFSQECMLGAPETFVTAMRAITPEGGLNAGRLVGTVDGGIIRAESIAAQALAAGAVTAEKIAAGAVDAEAVNAVSARLEKVYAEDVLTDRLYAALAAVIAMRVGAIEAESVEADELYAALSEVIEMRAEKAAVSELDTDKLTAAVAKMCDGRIGSADIGFAQIRDMVTGSAIITEGEAGKLYVARLSVTEANMVSLSVGELLVHGEDGQFYRLGVDENGEVSVDRAAVDGSQIAPGSMDAGKLVEGSVTARELNAEKIFADDAVVRRLIAENLDVGRLFAREATVAALNAADISGNGSLRLFVRQDELSTCLRLSDGKMELGEKESPVKVQLRTGDEAGLYIVEGARANAYFGENKAKIERLEMGEAILVGKTAIVAQNGGDDVYWLGR